MITETALEMHFHRPIMDLIRDAYGLGPTGHMNFYKYSPQRECFVGFDQAYVKTELSEEELFGMLRAAAASTYTLGDRFMGYFLQFKVVKEMQSFTKYTPRPIVRRPHYRVSLDTKKNMNTGVSQHELLYNLNHNNGGALVYYACPMLFDRAALYDVNVDLDALRLADLDACPSAYTDNDNHFIFYDGPHDDPVWCSDPVQGKALKPNEFAAVALAQARELSPQTLAANLLNLLTDTKAAGISPESDELKGKPTPSILSFVSESLTIVRLQQRVDAAQLGAAADAASPRG